MRLSPGQMGGLIVKAESFAGLWLTETLCPPHHQAPKHSHEAFNFCFVRDGSFTEHIGRRVRECVPLSLISQPRGEIHSNNYHDKGARSFVIEIEASWIEMARQHSVVLEEPAYFKRGLATWLAARLYGEFRSKDQASALAIQGLTLELLAIGSRQTAKPLERKPPRWLAQTVEILNSYFSKELDLRSIAKTVGVHPVHLARTFRIHHNRTLGEYVRGLRVEAACRELSLTDAPIAQIALSVGYYDQSHFSKNFKKLMGVTPAQYRAAFRPR